MRRTATAPAKINLFLHVGATDADGYHPLASLVAFADIGDRVSVQPAERLSLEVVGPFAAALADQDDNLILRALRRLGEATGEGAPALRVVLDKQLPIAAGLGGGSSDAGAALRLAAPMLGLAADDLALETAPVRIRCRECGSEHAVPPNRLLCGDCGSWRTELLAGDELVLQRLEFAAAAAAA